MTDRDALLATVIDRPADDLPRLVYADFLDEHGDPDRAEFIRVQCELARPTVDAPARMALLTRETELLDAHKPEWVVPDLRGGQRFRRGFVEALHTTADWFLADADRVFAATPLRDLRVANADARFEELVQVPGLARLEALDLTNNHMAAGGRLALLLGVAPLRSLTALALRNCRLWPEAVRTLAAAPATARLTRLDLSGNPLTDEGLTLVATEPAFANLTELVVRAEEQHFENCSHATAAAAVARSATLTKLRVLDLGGQYVGDAGTISLVSSPNAAGLEALDLSYNEIGETGEAAFEALVASPHLGRLRHLSLAGNRVDRRAAGALADWPRLAGGVVVDLRDCDMTDDARQLLASSPHADRLLLPDPAAIVFV